MPFSILEQLQAIATPPQPRLRPAPPKANKPPPRRTALYKVLHQIAENPGSTTASLMAATELSYPGVTKVLAQGVQFHWFERRSLANISNNGPRFSFYITPAGEKAYKDSHA